ncbi:hypothetical protein MNEG_12911 [Monoraphidium neglectum]|uniref:Uncharacterized protein n=1 Tax=Monoraphidium neglectum TaxID=145388 RepID=A0A0D2KGY3_9CHLO|nr:hypothetical protein MNEG_12911 [Monoraphidium neglectum]KIY95053.1 hypothetical protein MNEG_12911 [Monoraphidium neglectum]|eukprot:XP_013894073.1 hypothetical protein MNEG_12911 [Monoraphidium neglectum]
MRQPRPPQVPTDSDDRPLQEIAITGVTIFTNPFQEMRDEEAAKEAEEAKKTAGGNPQDPENQRSQWYSNPAASHAAAAVRSGVGKYVQDAKLDSGAGGGGGGVGGRALAAAAGGAAGAAGAAAGGSMQPPAPKKQKASGGFGNFDAW